ncbi:MAG: polyketide synthase, partial [Acidobacteriota bacterium]
MDAITEVPRERWDPAALAALEQADSLQIRRGGFLQEIDRFDHAFFGISPREAERMDPQQRLVLDVAWETLEEGGQPRRQLQGSATGVFLGVSNQEYRALQFSDPALLDAFAATGNSASIIANRLSYFFGWHGPSVVVDTACSSSLVAIHQAIASLARGESHLALAGGVNLILSPAGAITFSRAGVMARDGRCKAFDARADGFVRGEGVGMVLLKPLDRAL